MWCRVESAKGIRKRDNGIYYKKFKTKYNKIYLKLIITIKENIIKKIILIKIKIT